MEVPIPDHEAERLAALHACDILDTPPEVAFDRIVKLATQSLDVPVAAVSFVEDDRQWFKAAIGFPFCELPRQHSFCAHAILEEDVFVVPDATRDPRFAENPLVTEGMQVRFYAGAVLRAPGGQARGALCVVDTRPRELDERQRGILRDLAAVTVDALALRTRNLLLKEQHDFVQDRRAALTEINDALHAEIAQQKLVDRERRRSERRFRQIFNRASDQALLHDVDGRIIDVNATTCTALGYRREELLTLWVNDIVDPPVKPEVLARWRTMPVGEVISVEARHRRKDGTHLPVEVRLSVLETTEGRRVLALARDVTERRKQDELLHTRARQQQVISQLGLRTLRRDATHGEDALNALFAEALTLLSETLQMDLGSVFERLPEPNLYAWRAAYQWPGNRAGRIITLDGDNGSLVGYALLTKGPVVVEDYGAETRLSAPPILLEQGVVSSLAVVIYTEGEAPFGTLNVHSRRAKQFTADDVSFLQAVANILAAAVAREAARERVQTALEEAAAARQTAEKANAAKSGFLSRMSHELRTPLNAILGFGQLLELEASDPQEADCVQHILKAGRHLLGLINEVLDISRAETGELHLALSQVDVGVVLRECVGMVTQLALDRNILCEVILPPRHTHRWTDEQRLRQILLNLLSNAIKYNREGGRIVVSADPTPGDGLRIKVSDTGVGMTPEATGRLFVPFDRLGQDRGDVQGTGLGLVVSRRLAEAMGGSLGVESEPGRGSTFWLDLPGDKEPPAETSVPVPTQAEAGSENFREPEAVSVLYIEDNFSSLQAVETLLARARPRWEFLWTNEGAEGMEIARREQPSVILLDPHLPGFTSDEVRAELRADPSTRHIPVLMLPADPAAAHGGERPAADGAEGYLSKPLELEDLLERVEQALAKEEVV